MKTIAIITTPGSLKRDFVNRLQKETAGAVKIVFIQKPGTKTFLGRAKSFYRKVGLGGLPKEIFYFFLLKWSKKKQAALNYRKEATLFFPHEKSYAAPVLETDDINSEEVYKKLSAIKPDIIAIWGGQIIKPRILEIACVALNMHFGLAELYRGSNAIANAILNDDWENVATTIHFAAAGVDAGDILAVVRADANQPPRDFFRQLNNLSVEKYIEIIKKILKGEHLLSVKQDLSRGRTYRLKDWTYAKQNELAKKLLRRQAKWSIINRYDR